MTFKPSDAPLLEKLDIFNEATTVILVDALVIFSTANVTASMNFEGDVFLIFCLIGNISVHLFFLIKELVVSAKRTIYKCKLRCRKRQSERVKKEALRSQKIESNDQEQHEHEAIDI